MPNQIQFSGVVTDLDVQDSLHLNFKKHFIPTRYLKGIVDPVS